MSAARHLSIVDIFQQAIEHARGLGYTTGQIVEEMEGFCAALGELENPTFPGWDHDPEDIVDVLEHLGKLGDDPEDDDPPALRLVRFDGE